MEFPHLGKHCSEAQCRRLDFLPVKCDGCSKIFCMDHYSYGGHNCPAAYKKDVQVPVCPLCNALVPGKADELPDIRVSRHIDADCSSDTAITRRKKVYNNRCSLKGCKQRELVPVRCDRCNLNYCLKHRHEVDHACSTITAKPVSKAGNAALTRLGQTSSSGTSGNPRSGSNNSNPRSFLSSLTGGGSRPSGNPTRNLSTLQGNISEDEALRMALQASLSTPGNPSTDPAALSQEQEDFLLAKALAESEMAAAGGAPSSTSRRQGQNCEIC